MSQKSYLKPFNTWQKINYNPNDEYNPPEKLQYSRTMPIKTISEANTREHWAKANKRHSEQKFTVWSYMKADSPDVRTPCIIKLTRIAPRSLDRHENLPMSMKYILDQICDYIHPGKAAGRADDDPNIHVEYAQEKGSPKEYAVRIEITRNPANSSSNT